MTQQRSLARSERRREYVLAAALSTFARDGYQASMGDIARAAGITRTVLYYYFDSKKELFEAVFQQELAELVQYVGVAALAPGGPIERGRNILRLLLEFAQRKPDAWNLLFRQTDESEQDVFEVRSQTRAALRATATMMLAEDIRKAGFAADSHATEVIFEMALGGIISAIAWWQAHPAVAIEEIEEAAVFVLAGARDWE